MGKLHPHGDARHLRRAGADGPAVHAAAAAGRRARQLRLARRRPGRRPLHRVPAGAAALLMTDGLDEDTVDFVPNYDDQLTQPEVLPAGLSRTCWSTARAGIAVGMATNMPPHNLVEVVGAAAAPHHAPRRHPRRPDAVRPGPDLPTGGKIVGLDGIREAYATGAARSAPARPRGSRTSPPGARASSSPSCPTRSGPEKVIEKIKDAGPGQEAPGHLRRHGPHRPRARPAPGHRGQERLQPRGRARAAVPADADGGVVRHQQRRPGRRPAAHARAARAAAGLRRPPAGRRAPALRVPARQARATGCTSSRACSWRSSTSTRSSGHPRPATTRRRPRDPADAACSTCPRSRPSTSSRCRCAG